MSCPPHAQLPGAPAAPDPRRAPTTHPMKIRILIPGWLPESWNLYTRKHWSKQRKDVERASLQLIAAMGTPRPRFTGHVEIDFYRWSTKLLDHDNAAASWKTIGDALVRLQVLRDDDPATIVRWDPYQRLVPHESHEGTEIVIADVLPPKPNEFYLSPFVTMRR